MIAPWLAASALPTGAPSDAYATTLSWGVGAQRVGWLALLGGAAFVVLGSAREGARGARRALALAALCLAASLVLATPAARDHAPSLVESAYAGTRVLSVVPGASLDSPPPAERAFGVLTGETTGSNVSDALLLGPFPAKRHDVWNVGLVVHDRAWEGPDAPSLHVDLPATCVPTVREDGRATGQRPAYVAWWQCVVQSEGTATVRVALPGRAPGDATLIATVLPSTDLALLGPVAGTWAWLSGAMAAAAGGAAILAWRRAPAG